MVRPFHSRSAASSTVAAGKRKGASRGGPPGEPLARRPAACDRCPYCRKAMRSVVNRTISTQIAAVP